VRVKVELSAADVAELRQAISSYREHMFHMARLMDDTRYLGSLAWMEEFRLRLLGFAEECGTND